MSGLDALAEKVHDNPRLAAHEALVLVTRARAANDDSLEAAALTVLGRARRALGEVDLAEGELHAAIRAAQRADDLALEADAQLALAGVLSIGGRAAEAFPLLDAAERSGGTTTRRRARLQRALVEQRLGRPDDALLTYQTVLPDLLATGASRDAGLVLMNMAIIAGEAGAGRRALALLEQAEGRFQAAGHGYGLAQVRHNRGWVHGGLGDLPRALADLDSAAAMFADLGHDAPELDVDRVEALVAAGLGAQAAGLAERVLLILAATGDGSREATAWLLLARAEALCADPRAGAHAARAEAMFTAQGATAWALGARLEALLNDDDPDLDELVRLAGTLDAHGQARAAAVAYGLAAVAATRTPCPPGRAEDPAEELAEQCRRRAAALGNVEVDVLAAWAGAVVARARGDRPGTIRLVRSGLDALDRHRAGMAAADVRAAMAVHARRLAQVGLQLGADDGPRELLAWIDRLRAAALWRCPALEGAAAEELGRVRAAAARVRECEAAGEDPTEAAAHLHRSEQLFHRRHLRAAAGSASEGSSTVPDPHDLDADLDAALVASAGRHGGHGVMVALTEVGGRLLAVRVEPGRSRLLDLGDATRAAAAGDAVRAGVRSWADPRRSEQGRARALTLVERGLAEWGAITAAATHGEGPVVLVVPARHHPLPWQLVPGLEGRPVVVAPSPGWWVRAVRAPGRSGSPRVLAVAGPRLREAEPEAEVAARHPGATLLVGAAADVVSTRAALLGADLAHLACHAHSRTDNPLWSCLDLADGPLYGYDLQGFPQLPRRMVLSGCDTAAGTAGGEETLGLAAVLLGGGSRSVLATGAALPDLPETRELMVALHERLRRGDTLAAAVADVAAGASGPSRGVLATLTCMGADT